MPSDTTRNPAIVSVAVPVPLRKTFDFLVPQDTLNIELGARVKVPFGKRRLVGVVTEMKDDSDYPKNKLKPLLEVLDTESLFDTHLWATLQWLSRYYLAPIGEVLSGAIPTKLRQVKSIEPAKQRFWQLTGAGLNTDLSELSRAPLQKAIVQRLRTELTLTAEDFKTEQSSWRSAIKALLEKGWLVENQRVPQITMSPPQSKPDSTIELNDEQKKAIKALNQQVTDGAFSCSLLHGVTGSGKTEVYFGVMRTVLDKGKQVLMLVPEIGLTPQLIARVENEYSVPLVAMHSGLNDSERHQAWWHTRNGAAKIVIGTRSAVFSSFKNLGLIVVDEEHDASFKQQDGVRYQARDVAIYRAKQQGIPIVLGSATPSLETYANAQQRYQKLELTKRATATALPQIELIDSAATPTIDGLSPAMFNAITTTLQLRKQVMLFINRRGFAPVLYCKSCGASHKCHRCDSNLTLHKRDDRLRCHHCGFEGRVSEQCGSCGASELVEIGEGTQRVEDSLAERLPNAKILRIDRDSSRRKGQLTELLQQARDGEADILIGTQLITKGHDFPNVAMVGVLGADQGLYSIDYRASEALFQQIVQVAGRAGRRDSVGKVLIQTAFPKHPFFTWVRNHDYVGFVENLMTERRAANYPPFGYFALLRAEATASNTALGFLRKAKHDLAAQIHSNSIEGVRLMDAIPAPLPRRAGKYRAQLLVCASQRSSLNTALCAWLNFLETNQTAKRLAARVRWSLDIDPYDHF